MFGLYSQYVYICSVDTMYHGVKLRKKIDMKRYWFQLLTSNYDELNVCIPDGSSKISATNLAKRWMKQNNINSAILAVNSMVTSNILDMIQIEL